MGKDILKFGVVSGLGRGAYLASLYSQHPKAELVAMCDNDPTAFEKGRKVFGLKKGSYREYQDLDDMLSKEDMDWVFVATGDPTHYPLGKKVLQAGCNLFVEKPMCVTMEQADDLWKTEQETGLAVVVGCELRYHAAVIKFRDILRKGTIGKVVLGYCLSTQKRGYGYFRSKYAHKSYGSPPLMQKGIHLTDLVIDLNNSDPVRVFASGGQDLYGSRKECRGRVCTNCKEADTCDFHFYNGASIVKKKKDINKKNPLPNEITCVFDDRIDVNDNSLLLVDFENGARMAVAEIFFAPENRWEFILQGTKGEARLNMIMGPAVHKSTIEVFTFKDRRPRKVKIPPVEGSHGGGDIAMRDALVEAYLQGRRISPTAREGRAGIATLIKAMESEETGEIMEIPWPDIQKKSISPSLKKRGRR